MISDPCGMQHAQPPIVPGNQRNPASKYCPPVATVDVTRKHEMSIQTSTWDTCRERLLCYPGLRVNLSASIVCEHHYCILLSNYN